jgi:hypothetical protein
MEDGSGCGPERWSLPPNRRFHMKNHERELSERFDLLSHDELDAVSGGDEVAHLPQSIHMDYSRLSINENPTRLA